MLTIPKRYRILHSRKVVNEMAKEVVFSTDVEKEVADKFDKIAEKNFRSRSAHLQFLIEKEVESENG